MQRITSVKITDSKIKFYKKVRIKLSITTRKEVHNKIISQLKSFKMQIKINKWKVGLDRLLITTNKMKRPNLNKCNSLFINRPINSFFNKDF